MDIDDILYGLVHDYPGGVATMAIRVKENENTLQKRVDPNTTTHHTPVKLAARIADVANSDDVAKWFAARRNMVCIPVPVDDDKSDMALLDLYLSDGEERGQWSSAVKVALADGMVDAGEYERINKEYLECCAAGAQLMARLKSMITERRKVARAG
jgi:hypothetical protein